MSSCPLKKCLLSLWDMVEAFAHHREGGKGDLTWSIFSQVLPGRACSLWVETRGAEDNPGLRVVRPDTGGT